MAHSFGRGQNTEFFGLMAKWDFSPKDGNLKQFICYKPTLAIANRQDFCAVIRAMMGVLSLNTYVLLGQRPVCRRILIHPASKYHVYLVINRGGIQAGPTGGLHYFNGKLFSNGLAWVFFCLWMRESS